MILDFNNKLSNFNHHSKNVFCDLITINYKIELNIF